MLNGLDLFSGIGGLSMALSPWVRTVVYCEQDRYAQAVLLSRMAESKLHYAPIWDDVRTLRSEFIPEIDIIFGGFPCQDISVAGNGAGLGGSRSGLFFEIIRLVSELRPRFIFLENVPAITVRGLDRVLLDLTALGYDCRWTIVSAAEMGAPHLRERWFLLSRDTNGTDVGEIGKICRGETSNSSGICETVADSAIAGLERWEQPKTSRPALRFASNGGQSTQWWTTEPDVGRVANGVPAKVDRLRCLGNAVVPAQAREAFKRLAGLQ